MRLGLLIISDVTIKYVDPDVFVPNTDGVPENMQFVCMFLQLNLGGKKC